MKGWSCFADGLVSFRSAYHFLCACLLENVHGCWLRTTMISKLPDALFSPGLPPTPTDPQRTGSRVCSARVEPITQETTTKSTPSKNWCLRATANSTAARGIRVHSPRLVRQPHMWSAEREHHPEDTWCWGESESGDLRDSVRLLGLFPSPPALSSTVQLVRDLHVIEFAFAFERGLFDRERSPSATPSASSRCPASQRQVFPAGTALRLVLLLHPLALACPTRERRWPGDEVRLNQINAFSAELNRLHSYYLRRRSLPTCFLLQRVEPKRCQAPLGRFRIAISLPSAPLRARFCCRPGWCSAACTAYAKKGRRLTAVSKGKVGAGGREANDQVGEVETRPQRNVNTEVE